MLTDILLETPGRGDDPWSTRAVPNKYPALEPDGHSDRRTAGPYLTMEGVGKHEVIIETPHHNRQIAQMEVREVETVLETYHRRYTDLMTELSFAFSVLFRNHGEHAGTSLLHPHSQIIASNFVPQHVRRREEKAQSYHDQWGKCVVCDMIHFEREMQSRVILENQYFVAFVPFAAEMPCELWITPFRHASDFGSISDEEKGGLASILHKAIQKLYYHLNDPDYNYVLITASAGKAAEPQLHWYLRILPRLTMRAGFEIGSGICINPSLPEQDAELLRKEHQE